MHLVKLSLQLFSEWLENLPPGSDLFMSSATFTKCLTQFSKYKTPGPALLILDGVLSHLDANIVVEADKHEITLFCLPSNTTNELQLLEKSLFKAFESYWNDDVMLFWQGIFRTTIHLTVQIGNIDLEKSLLMYGRKQRPLKL